MNKLQQVADILKQKGSTDEQIARFLAELTKANFAKFYTAAMTMFTDEDMATIEACTSEEHANEKIKELYQLRTGKNPQEEMQKFLDDFAIGFIAEYEKERAAA
ncbi:hypothetical protein A3B42_01845 [Candidatus Daviesbacteria bacterium RIFCSPLOWO2_01_FULL_38_10]|nr:MAG: hypothetical protein A3D02_00125 [Candidatus Daviesbacteria bacterium RIFCSPHIGHO2_02_FULL_39_41]OGE40161.1 MAG: hypothetical protein A3B42_01845 [Candidatus Daviesbacteria bacterium RIFCSPLOWO2_01_FULL_38_10]OGE45491.1 MAG: hypothetical protein A3E67_03895 [Candidatus Daviesbacteria bacterium RIFCSPHIGHO2_12_FULL_38_25]OGE67577.1 MAG: hypothetical protein A3H81_01040 [Candidatus Daviesbacteria bacterium RIFCSPLOWO2_02_FULL_38_18]OGE72797.1 MAG: hypothetical protein A3H18_04010 [Candida